MRLRSFVVAASILGASLVPISAGAATVYDVTWVESVGGAQIRLEVRRDPRFDPQPVLLTYSAYTVHAGAQPANDPLAARYNPRGFARAVAHVIGTGGSDGCWDYGGKLEQQSGVDVVKALAAMSWSNGNVGMIGVSYEGTTATMVAARGEDVPELKAIVPIASISRWYGYAFHDGVRYFLNSEVPTDEGIDTPLVFDSVYAKTVSLDRNDPRMAQVIASRAAECGAVEHTLQGYARNPDYGQFWLDRDYRKDAADFRAAVMVVHGWQDYNVKQEEGLSLFEALPVDDPDTVTIEGVPFKKLYLTQEPHADGTGSKYLPLLDAFLNRTLRGIDTGVERLPEVLTLGRDHVGPLLSYAEEAAWPPVGSGILDLHLGRSFDPIAGVPSAGPVGTTGETGILSLEPQSTGGGWTHVDPGFITEELTLRDPLNQDGHGYYSLFHQSPTLTRDVRIAGRAQLDGFVNATTPGQHLSPLLVDVHPDGSLSLIERGFLNLDYRNGLTTAEPATGWMHARVRFLPQDYTVRAGHAIGLILQGSNLIWAVPGSPGVTSYALGPVPGVTDQGMRLRLSITDIDGAHDHPPFQ